VRAKVECVLFSRRGADAVGWNALGAHGDVERLAVSSLLPFVQYVWNVVTEVAGHK